MSKDKTVEFSGFRKVVWPVHSFELKKVLPMAFMMFCVLFNYTILRDVKDSLVVTNCGAEAISFIKVYGTLPFAIIFMAIYAKLSTTLSKQQLFNTMMMVFIIFFAVFGFVLFPLRETLHMSPENLELWQADYPRAKYVLSLIGNWSYSIFYIFSELWGTVGLSVLFWQFANEITKVKEAKRFYPLFGLIGNVGLLCSGALLVAVAEYFKDFAPMERWAISLKWIIVALLISCFGIIYLYNWVCKNVMTDKRLYNPEESAGAKKKKKVKLSFGESMKVVFGSKYLLFLAVMVLAYGISINLVEVTWKSQMKLQFSDELSYTKAMGYFSMTTGAATIVLMIAGANILRRFGWYVGAMLTPLMMLITGSLFFAFIVFRDQASPLLLAVGATPILMAVIIGWAQNVLTKGAKYSLFDPTKEMAYIPLPDDLRTQGKAAVDGVGGRLGKSGGAIIQQGLLVGIAGATQISLAPYVGGILMFVVIAWLYSATKLNKEFQKLSHEQDDVK